MELRDGDLVLRPWTEDDVPALVAGCNDPEIAHWIPTIPHPYTDADALAFIRGEARGDHEALAIEVNGGVVGGSGIGVNTNDYRGRIGYWVAASTRGRGVATRALRVPSRHAPDVRGLPRAGLVSH